MGILSESGTGTKQYKILIAEDNECNQEIAALRLRKYNCNIDVAFNGREAVEAAKRKHYDMILMDIDMPEMDGIEATRQIKSAPDIGPVIMTAYTSLRTEVEQQRMREVGMDFVLFKPVGESDFDRLWEMAFCGTDGAAVSKAENTHIASDFYYKGLNLEFLMLLTGGNPQAMKERLERFSDSMAECISIIELSIQSGDFDRIRAISHKNATSANVFDAAGVLNVELCSMEIFAKNKDAEGCTKSLPELKRARAETIEGIENYIRTVVS